MRGDGTEAERIKKAGLFRGILERDVLIFAFFLALSFIFWYLNGLDNEIENTIRYPVRYVNPPSDRVLTGDLPPRLEMQIKGPGYSILKLRLSGNRAPVIIDMSRLEYNEFPDSDQSIYLYILTNRLRETFHRQLRADFEIIRIAPDTLVFSFDRLVTRKIPVLADIEVNTDEDFFMRGVPEVTPDSVLVTGPEPVIDTIRHIRTRHRRFKGINQSFSRNLQLEGSRLYTVSERRVSVNVSVEQYTEARLELPVKMLNLPDSIDIKLFPDVVSVRLQVAVSDYKAVFQSNIQAVTDISSVIIESAGKLPVTIINVPVSAKSLLYTPQELDFIIESRRQ
ncbi:MAG: hypothetical protein R6W67_01820 [Bacteroidales bacterium]